MKKPFLNILFFIFSFCFLFNSLFAQEVSFKKGSFSIKKVGTVNLSEIKDDWMPLLQNIEMPKPGGKAANKELERIKKQLSHRYSQKINYKTNNKKSLSYLGQAPSPILQNNFEGNVASSGSPLDNDMAISNAGKIVSVINTVIYVFDINDLGSSPWKKSLESFAIVDTAVPVNNTFNNYNHKYDPKVIYDPENDRFILVMLNGTSSIYSKIIVAFSQTNDPTLGWNIYVVPGNPLNNDMWTDYPQIGMTQEDFFMTINLLTDDDSGVPPGHPKPWELTFKDDIIWQINKEDGYAGLPILSADFFHGLEYNGKLLQYICPIKSGDDQLEPNIYLLSNKAFTAGTDTIFLVQINNSLKSGNASVDFITGKLDVQYYVPPNAQQPYGGDTLFTNDARILGGFYHNQQIQFVFPTLDTNTGLSAIYHGIIKNITSAGFQATGKIIGSDSLEFGYPNISYTGSSINYTGIDKSESESIITFDHSSSTVFPGISAVFYNNGSYSNILEVKKGDTIINSSTTTSRWGDYTGSQAKYNESGKVWVSGTFGSRGTSGNLRKYGTWIAEIESPNDPSPLVSNSEVVVFPNPSTDLFSVYFNLEKDVYLRINLYNVRGNLVTTLLEKSARAGENVFSFSTSVLASGIYYLEIYSEEKNIALKKVVKL